MLDDLDGVEWSRLRDAYGPATPVRDNLLRLTSDIAGVREGAIQQLYMGICHQQCTVSEATPAAVPFLMRLAASPRTQDRGAILRLLGDIARAGAANAAETSESLPDASASDLERLRTWGRRSAAAVWSGFQDLLQLLCQDAMDLRIGSAFVLSFLLRHAREHRPEALNLEFSAVRFFDSVATVLRDSEDQMEQLAMVYALADLADISTEARERLQELTVVGGCFEVRLASAFLLVEQGEKATSAMAALIREGLDRGNDLDPAFQDLPWYESRIRFRLAECLTKLPEAEISEDQILQLLAKSSSHTADEDARPILLRLFAGTPQGVKAEDLTEFQRRALRTLLDNNEYWKGVANGEFVLAAVKLPSDRASLSRFLGMVGPRVRRPRVLNAENSLGRKPKPWWRFWR